MLIKFQLNSLQAEASCEPGMTLFEYLRQQGYYSVKFGCDHGECGACAVLVDGIAMNSCLLLIHTVAGKKIETVEGLTDNRAVKAIQDAFLEEGAVQCGYCTPGMIISIEALLREKSEFTETDVRDALAGNLCRCTGYVKPVAAALSLHDREEQ